MPGVEKLNAGAASVGVISKVLRILEALQGSSAGLGLKAICDRTGIHKSTAHRFLKHLERERYLIRTEAGAYLIGPRLSQLSARGNQDATLQAVARPILWELWKSTQETVNLAVLDGGTVLYVDVIESSHEFRLASRVGTRRPVHATSLGKAICAFLPEELLKRTLEGLVLPSLTPNTVINLVQFRRELDRVRHNGYALDDEEVTLGARCVGAPILGKNQEAVAAISISGPVTRMGREQLPSLAAAAIEASSRISAAMGLTQTSAVKNTSAKEVPSVASGRM